MKKRLIVCSFFAISFVACIMKPMGIIGEKKMEDIIYDITLTDAIIDTYGTKISPEERRKLYDDIYAKYGTDDDKYRKSLEWYTQHPKYIELIYDNVRNRINTLKAEVADYKFHPEERVADELRQLDTIDLYKFEPHYAFTTTPPTDSLKFSVESKDSFAMADKFIFTMMVKADRFGKGNDTLQNSDIEFTVTYSDGVKKIFKIPVIANKKTYRYTFAPTVRPEAVTAKVEGNIFNSRELIRNIRIDSVRLIRIYNSRKYPLPQSMPTEIATENIVVDRADMDNIILDDKVLNN